ncbi:YHYH domain-containing protein [Brevibacillus choshinensis]|nr:YHYH domain-containing protein [Brevibacillus choshinensis]
MKYFYRFILACSILVIPFSVADAHPGRTDKNGGHT